MKRWLNILLLLIIIQNLCVGQFKKHLDSLYIICNHITSDSEKVVTLGRIADLYFSYYLSRQGDSVVHEQLLVAEQSLNNNLILAALFDSPITHLHSNAPIESFDKAVLFIQKGIDFAKSQNQYDYIALGYTRMAFILLKLGQNDKAFSYATQGLQLLPRVSDSIKILVYINLGNVYQARGEAVSAATNYNNAFDIAIKLNSVPLQSEIYLCFSNMYSNSTVLENKNVAVEFLNKSLRLDKEYNYLKGQLRDYYILGNITYEKPYIEKAIALSDSLHMYDYNLGAKRLKLYYYMLVEKNSDTALKYLENEPDIKESFVDPGIGNYYQVKGEIFYNAGKIDSAIHYYKLAETDFIKNSDEKQHVDLFSLIAHSYKKMNDILNATIYYLKALDLSKKMNDLNSIASISNSLSDLYNQQGDYKQAFDYVIQAKVYTDSLSVLSKDRDIALLDVGRENRKHENELLEEARKQNNKRDIQYMVITIFISVVFVIMLVIGMFPVSKLTIKLLGYFFFISLFEFIVMIIDNSLFAKMVHNEPLKLWLIKILLIALLVPIQHFLEHKLIKFLESRILLDARTKFSLNKWWQNIKKPTSNINDDIDADIEKDTAVL